MNSFDEWLKKNADECTEEEYLELMCGKPPTQEDSKDE